MVDIFSHDHVDHQTETNSDHPSTSTTSTQEQSPEATTAVERVLGPFDVLLLVISEAPLRERTSIRLVSKAWRYAVDRLALKPVGYDCWKSEAVPSVPIYRIDPDDGELRLNCYSGLARHMLRPNMARTKGFTRTHMPIGPRQVVLRLEDLQTLIMYEHEFMTHPVITQALVCAHSKEFVGLSEESVAVLRVPGGIRLGDLLECFEKFNLTCDHHVYYVRFAWQR